MQNIDIQDVVKKNRETLSRVDFFITDEDYDNSLDNYGLPLHVRHLIDLPIDKNLTYVDVLMFLKSQLKTENPKYVEIGVSVLKTFYQVSNFLEDSELYAFDINKINPSIAKKFDLKQKGYQVNKYNYNGNKITHFKGDVFKKEDFDLFKKEVNGRVNIIFSDAHHTGEGLRAEYDSFIKDGLSDDFILYYDDLQNPPMQKVFLEICQEHQQKNPSTTGGFLKVNGWLGQHEDPHINGIITSIDIRNVFPFINYI
jgi:hypothetical protein